MEIALTQSLARRVFIPYETHGRRYHLLFFAESKGPFVVEDAPYSFSGLITVGLLKAQKKVVGNIFYTTAQTLCHGTSLLAYSGVFKNTVMRRPPKDLNMQVVVKTPFMQVYNQTNRATLVVSTAMSDVMRANLEV